MALALPASLAAQESGSAPGRPRAPLQQSIGTYLESNIETGDQDLMRLPVLWSLGAGSPRVVLLEIEPALGWHFTGGTGDASGLSYTRLRFYHFFGSGRLTVGPDIEAYIKTESNELLGYGYDRFMPGVQASLALPRGWRTVFRVRYEFTEDENPGVTPFGRVVLRPAVYPPPIERWAFWARGDLAFDVHGQPGQYNVEALASVRPDARRRLTLFVEPRVYLGAASRAKNLWRLRSGFSWSLGDVVLHHAEGS
ncbi:MAG: hypothetical protein ACHQX4_03705 [Gemmatimonadales bacterium]